MKIQLVIAFLGVVLNFQNGNAQVTAVMEVRVVVISGAGYSEIEENLIALNSPQTTFSNIGSFDLTSSPDSDVQISLINGAAFTNEFGEILHFKSFSYQQNKNSAGHHYISIDGEIEYLISAQGHYKGKVTAVVDYF